MREVVLSARMQALVTLTTPGLSYADVGCDHGFVSIYLVQTGRCPYVLAMDVRPGPLSRAVEHIEAYELTEHIDARLSDGLTGLSPYEVQGMLCAGMGGRLMKRILTEGRDTAYTLKELVLQPQSELLEFREFLGREGYRIFAEDMVYEDGKYYFLMKAVPPSNGGSKELGNLYQGSVAEGISPALSQRFGGLLLAGKHPLLPDYLHRELAGTRKLLGELKGAHGERSLMRREELLTECGYLEEAIRLVM